MIAPALQASAGEGRQVYASSGATIVDTLERPARAALASGDIRADVSPDDLYPMLVGVSHGYDQPDREPGARRLIAIPMAGLKPAL